MSLKSVSISVYLGCFRVCFRVISWIALVVKYSNGSTRITLIKHEHCDSKFQLDQSSMIRRSTIHNAALPADRLLSRVEPADNKPITQPEIATARSR